MHTILVPVDGSAHAQKALMVACDLAEKYGGQIALLHVLVEGKRARELLKLAAANKFSAPLKEALQAAAGRVGDVTPRALIEAAGEQILERAAGKVRRRGLFANILVMEAGNPAKTILKAQRRTGAGTIVMGCRGLKPDSTTSFGSVSNAVFQEAQCTCLSVK